MRHPTGTATAREPHSGQLPPVAHVREPGPESSGQGRS